MGREEMYYTIFVALLSSILMFITYIGHRKPARLPPGPYPYPIIGSIFKLGNKPHQSLAALSKTYGPLMSLKLGSLTTIVVSSPTVAKEFLQTCDRSFSGRSLPHVICVIDHPKYSLVWSQVNDQWLKLRRICKEQLFSTHRLDASKHLREKKVQQLVEYVQHCCDTGDAVVIGRTVFTTTVNALSNFIFSTDFAPSDSASSQEFKDTVWEMLEVAGTPNLSDFFPVLKMIDPQGLWRKSNAYSSKLSSMFEEIISQREEARAFTGSDVSTKRNDVLDLMLDLAEDNDSELCRKDILHLFLDLFTGGSDTTSSTVEWAMTELIRNRDKMEKARAELRETIKESPLKESDIPKLPYLQAVVKETLRLHPPVPFLGPRKAVSDVEVQGGFVVPKGAQILTNVWAMARDPSVWPNPSAFMPERFLGTQVDFKGRDFELIPFGSGRRICPGLPLADRMLPLILGSLLYSFDWELEGAMSGEEVDMSDKFGITLQKAVPLTAIPIKSNVLQE